MKDLIGNFSKKRRVLRGARVGFTLAELLIALAILGVIVTFTVPKILGGQSNAQKKAVFRESVAALSQIMYLATLYGTASGSYWLGSGSIPGCSGYNSYCFFITRMNALKICPSLTDIASCFAATDLTGFPTYPGSPHATRGVVLANGASIVMDWQGGGAAGVVGRFLVDWNGTDAPNQLGDDQLVLQGGYGPQKVTIYVLPGRVDSFPLAVPAENTKNTNLYNQIFQ